MQFADRRQAGQLLGDLLQSHVVHDPVVVGLPRGGVVVADEVARALGAPLDVIVVRKLGVPWQPELAMGAIGEDGVRTLNRTVLRQFDISEATFTEVESREREVVKERTRRLRGARPRIDLAGRRVIVVDDGIATGATASAASEVARLHGATWIVLAVPVAPHGWEAEFHDVANDLACVQSPDNLESVGHWYLNFRSVSDDEVVGILTEHSQDK